MSGSRGRGARGLPRLARCLQRLRREERGAAVVEFALILPVFMMLVFMFIDATRAFYTVNSLVSAAREGARYGAIQTLDCPGPSADQAARIRQRVKDAAVLFGGDTLADRNIAVSLGTGASGACENVHVRIDAYPFRPLTPIANMAGLATIPITREAVFRWERAP